MTQAIRNISIEDAYKSLTHRRELLAITDGAPLMSVRVTELEFDGNRMRVRLLSHRDEVWFEQAQVRVIPCLNTEQAICDAPCCKVEVPAAEATSTGVADMIAGEVPGSHFRHGMIDGPQV